MYECSAGEFKLGIKLVGVFQYCLNALLDLFDVGLSEGEVCGEKFDDFAGCVVDENVIVFYCVGVDFGGPGDFVESVLEFLLVGAGDFGNVVFGDVGELDEFHGACCVGY